MNSAQIIEKFPNKVALLTDILKKFNTRCLQKSYTSVEKRSPLINIIENAVCNRLNKKSKLIPVGSFVTKLDYNKKSDIDLVFFVKNLDFWEDFHSNFEFDKIFMLTIVDLIKNLNRENELLKLSEPPTIIRQTRAPLIIAKFESGFSIDIQFPRENFQTIRNTNYIRHCIMADKRFSQLFLWLKTVFVSMGIKKSFKGLFSSYHMLVLVVHFLQTNKNRLEVLPLLSKTHSNLVGNDVPIEVVIKMLNEPIVQLEDWKSKNTKSIGELIVEMTEYYMNFDPINYRICLDEYEPLPKLRSSTNILIMNDIYSRMSITRSQILSDLLTSSFSFLGMKMDNGELFESINYENLSKKFQEYCEDKPWVDALKNNSISDEKLVEAPEESFMEDEKSMEEGNNNKHIQKKTMKIKI